MQSLILNVSGANWTDFTQTEQHNSALKGQAHLDGDSLDQQVLPAHLHKAKSPDQTTNLLQRLNGFMDGWQKVFGDKTWPELPA